MRASWWARREERAFAHPTQPTTPFAIACPVCVVYPDNVG
jgi:hypothetical protein